MNNSCRKNASTFNNDIYEQIDGASMESRLKPTLANTIMAGLKIKVFDRLFKDGLLTFYIRYVDDTLEFIKESDIDNVLSKYNSFHPSLSFSVDRFNDGVVHYLDLKVIDSGADNYYKNTHTGQCTQFCRNTPCNIRTAWIKALYKRATKVC